jgi:hypothetical protein
LRIIPKDHVSELSTNPIGTGPFMFKSCSPGNRMELVKNPNHFEKGLPKLDGASILIIPEAAAHVNGVSRKVEGFHSTPMMWLDLNNVSPIARLTRSVTLGLANEEFIQAAKARGEKTADILFREILSNAWPPLIVEAGPRVTYAVLLGSIRA